MSEKKCRGCGIVLQDENVLLDGYTTNLENDLCQRCFKMKHYGEYQIVSKTNDEYLEVLKKVNETKDLVLHVEDILNVEQDLHKIRNYIDNKMVLVLNKRDALPLSVKDEKIIDYFKRSDLGYDDIIIIGTRTNYNMDELLHMIKKYKTSKRVYIVGNTNVGKSSLINKMMENYSKNPSDLTISPMPSTTLDTVAIELSDDLTLIDTPGLIDPGNITNDLSPEMLKKITPRKEIKPRTFQIKKGQCLLLDDILRIDYVEGEKNSFTFYVSNDLEIKKMNAKKQERLKDLGKTTVDVKYHEDLVIDGLGFVKIVAKCQIDVYLSKKVTIFTRDSLI